MSNRLTGRGRGWLGFTGIATLNLTAAAAGRHYYLHFQMRKQVSEEGKQVSEEGQSFASSPTAGK